MYVGQVFRIFLLEIGSKTANDLNLWLYTLNFLFNSVFFFGLQELILMRNERDSVEDKIHHLNWSLKWVFFKLGPGTKKAVLHRLEFLIVKAILHKTC